MLKKTKNEVEYETKNSDCCTGINRYLELL